MKTVGLGLDEFEQSEIMTVIREETAPLAPQSRREPTPMLIAEIRVGSSFDFHQMRSAPGVRLSFRQ